MYIKNLGYFVKFNLLNFRIFYSNYENKLDYLLLHNIANVQQYHKNYSLVQLINTRNWAISFSKRITHRNLINLFGNYY